LAALTPAFFVICALLAIAGARKVIAPQSTRESLALVAAPPPRLSVRALGALELVLGTLAAAWPTVVASALLAFAYGTFCALLVLLLRTKGGDIDCGCFGDAEHRVGMLHPALNALACAVAVACGVWGVHGLGWALSRPTLIAPPLIIGSVAATYAAYLAFTALPGAWGAYRSAAGR
jgi:hypothetical protein